MRPEDSIPHETHGPAPRAELPRPLLEFLLGGWTAAALALIPPFLLVCPAGLYLAAPWTHLVGVLAWLLFVTGFGLLATCFDLLFLHIQDRLHERDQQLDPQQQDDLYA